MEDDLPWKTNFDGRQPSMEDNLQWKTTFNGRQPFFWKTPPGDLFQYYYEYRNRDPTNITFFVVLNQIISYLGTGYIYTYLIIRNHNIMS